MLKSWYIHMILKIKNGFYLHYIVLSIFLLFLIDNAYAQKQVYSQKQILGSLPLIKISEANPLRRKVNINFEEIINKEGLEKQYNIPEGAPAIKNYTSDTGLLENAILDGKFDKDGYFVVTTHDYVLRYNGNKWKKLIKLPEQDSKFAGLLTTSTKDLLLLRNWNNENKILNLTTKNFIPVNLKQNDHIKGGIETIDQNGKSTLWILGLNTGLVKITGSEQKVVINAIDSNDNNYRQTIHSSYDKEKNLILWIPSKKGLYRYNATLNTINTYNTSNGFPDNTITAIDSYTYKNDVFIWASTLGGLVCIKNDAVEKIYTKKDGLPEFEINSIYSVNPSNSNWETWVGFISGKIGKWDGSKWYIFDKKVNFSNQNKIMSITSESKSDSTLWVTTNGSGVYRINNSGWKTISHQLSGLETSVNGFLETSPTKNTNDDTKQFWMATDLGLCYKQTSIWKCTKDASSGIIQINETINSNTEKSLWFINYNNDLYEFTNNKLYILDIKKVFKTLKFILYIYVPKDYPNLLFIMGEGGILVYDGNDWYSLKTPENLKYDLVNYLDIYLDEEENLNLWIASDAGLLHFYKNKWRIYSSKNGLLADMVYNFLIHSKNAKPATLKNNISKHQKKENFIILTRAGLSIATTETNTKDNTETWFPYGLKFFSLPDFYNEDNIYWYLKQDEQKRSYILHNRGVLRLSEIPPNSNSSSTPSFNYYNFTEEDGLPNRESSNYGLHISDNKVWAGTVKGAAFFDLSQEYPKLNKKNIFIESFQINKKEYPIKNQEKLAFPYNENNLYIEYALPVFFKEKDTKFKTHLIGLEESPSDWHNDIKKEYPSLTDGEYIFRLWGKDFAGNISGPIEISFIINAPPWKTKIAYSLYSITLIIFLLVVIKYRTKKLHQENLFLEEKILQRTKELYKSNEELVKKSEEVNNANDILKEKNNEMDIKNYELLQKNIELEKSKQELLETHKQSLVIFSALSEALPGTILDGKYQLNDIIGKGGFGVVYSAKHLLLKRDVAIKIFKPSYGNDSIESVERFKMEAITLCKVSHKNAVQVLDTGISSNGILYIVMELLSGESLEDEIKKKKNLSPKRCLEILKPVCELLHYLHNHSIIHRDMKPDNVFIHKNADEEIIKVLDFGISKLLENDGSNSINNITKAGSTFGTVLYMAPELILQENYDSKVDIYSIGVMAYKMLCGDTPFSNINSDAISIALKQINQTPPSLSSKVSLVDFEIESSVMLAMGKNKDKRPNSLEWINIFEKAVLNSKNPEQAYDIIYFNNNSYNDDNHNSSNNIENTVPLDNKSKS